MLNIKNAKVISSADSIVLRSGAYKVSVEPTSETKRLKRVYTPETIAWLCQYPDADFEVPKGLKVAAYFVVDGSRAYPTRYNAMHEGSPLRDSRGRWGAQALVLVPDFEKLGVSPEEVRGLPADWIVKVLEVA